MNSSGSSVGWALIVVLAAGAGLDWVERPPPGRSGAAERAVGSLFATSPTLGDLAADVAWVKLNVAWERGDAAAVRALIALTLEAAPDADYFRTNGARMLAFDLPAWRLRAEPAAPAGLRAAWRTRAAEEALALLLRGEETSAACWTEAATIALYGLGDRARAAELYRRAAEAPGAPWHAGRIHAQLLRELGRDREAVEWLRAWLPRLPADDPAAQRTLVAARLADLELELRSRGEPL